MSSNTPTSFASAAAGQSRGSRPGDDWSRRDGRSVNGTMTFRRSSATATNQQPLSASDPAASSLPPVTESHTAQPTLPPFDGSQRYSRDELLDIFKGTAAESVDVSGLFVSGWNPTQANGGQRGWGKSSEGTVPQDPTVCWEANGGVRPVGIQAMSEEEKELFVDVNSTLKPQQLKDNSQGSGNNGNASGLNGRKTSVSHGTGYNSNGSNALSSIASSRPATRRREASDTTPFPSGGLASPLTGRTPREESSWFGRKTDAKETQPSTQQFEEPEEEPSSSTRPPNIGSLSRGNTSGSALGGGSASLWGASNQVPTPTAGTFGSFALPAATGDKRFGSVRGESRLAHLIPKQEGADSTASGSKAAATGNAGASGGPNVKDSWKPRQRTDTDPFGTEAGQTQQGNFDTPIKNARGDFGMSGLNIGSSLDEDGAGSPGTNPYRSPPAEQTGAGGLEDDQHPHSAAAPGGVFGSNGGPDPASAFGSVRGGYPGAAFDGSDRSQTSSVGAKGFSGLGNIAGWGHPLTSSTPDRERAVFSSAFGNSLFSPGTGELQSPGFGSGVPGGVFGPPGAAGTGSLRSTTSKLNALFPASMQAQMSANQEQEGGGLGDSVPDLRQINPLGAIGREAVGSQARDADAGGSRTMRSLFDDPMDPSRAGPSGFTSEQGLQPNNLASASSPLPSGFDSVSRSNVDASTNVPRTMVMPDRMRWVYLDPQGQTQGPFTGLEMNDWYKANFFTPDLRVRKVEDTEFEPLGQLIRRIGNSREPFLVPQIGVAHGQPSLSGTFVHGNHGGVVPPLVGAFPSYGRTLTAEEQNNLERRKQEEQYVLARQREMLVVPHHAPPPFTAGRPGAVGAPGTALQHHSSAHSLQSQPSFGSMTSPLATGPPPISGHIGSSSGFFDPSSLPPTTQPPVNHSSEFLHDDYSFQDRMMLSGMQQTGLGGMGNFQPSQQSGHAVDQHSLGHLPSANELQKDSQGFNERLLEFKKLRDDLESDGAGGFQSGASMPGSSQQAKDVDTMGQVALERQRQDTHQSTLDGDASFASAMSLSLTQRVQKTQEAAAKQRETGQEVAETVQPDLPLPFPPPQGGMPLAAPTAQRTRSTLPDQYAVSRSRSETPESGAINATQPPPLAPWARDPGSESHRGPSLKEIQEAEAKKAAKHGEIAAAARRVAVEHEAALQREREKASAAPAPGLPTSSTWGNGTPSSSTAIPVSSWAKAPSAKPSAAGQTGGSSAASAAERKKTLADIQREEEASKQKTRELSSQSPLGLSHGVGKRYADLAGRGQPPAAANSIASSASPASTAVASGWATVGAGGKVKTPTGPAVVRATSVATPAVKPVAARAVSRQVPGTAGKADSNVAMEEFNKWLHREVSRGVTDDIDVNVFVDLLSQLPMEPMIIADAVYGSSKTMDGRHFAEEFIRRKKLAEKGIVDTQAPASSNDNKAGGGWSEVAKKGSASASAHQKEESMPPGFKVVPSRKKGRK